jgi:hypothetical protein
LRITLRICKRKQKRGKNEKEGKHKKRGETYTESNSFQSLWCWKEKERKHESKERKKRTNLGCVREPAKYTPEPYLHESTRMKICKKQTQKR